ncbi:hypothetical protein [Clostridium niameyense]|uniref:hypothetical protein n=1 Tax=Clostridium niameyense TaxID=1622073 RepID=UPI001969E182|nr:hypothetical protein [Clostridium niameyense]
MDSLRTSKENIEMLRRKYHKGSDFWRVCVLGEFTKGELDSLISLEVVETAMNTKANIDISTLFILEVI